MIFVWKRPTDVYIFSRQRIYSETIFSPHETLSLRLRAAHSWISNVRCKTFSRTSRKSHVMQIRIKCLWRRAEKFQNKITYWLARPFRLRTERAAFGSSFFHFLVEQVAAIYSKYVLFVWSGERRTCFTWVRKLFLSMSFVFILFTSPPLTCLLSYRRCSSGIHSFRRAARRPSPLNAQFSDSKVSIASLEKWGATTYKFRRGTE